MQQDISTDELIEKLVDVTREFNRPRTKRADKQALISIADAVRSELARRGRVVSVEELCLWLSDPVGD